MTECTCCAAHGMGVHRSSDPVPAITRPQMIETPELVKAHAERARADAATERARNDWNEAFGRAVAARDRLSQAYHWHANGIAGATRSEKRELEQLHAAADEKFEKFQAAGRAAIAVHREVDAAQHRATQQTLAAWAAHEEMPS